MLLVVIYIVLVVAANVAGAMLLLPLGPYLILPIGSIIIGPIYTLRDVIHRRAGLWAAVHVVLVASLLSFLVARALDHDLLLAVSAGRLAALIAGELVDTLIYQLLRRRTWGERVLMSNSISILVDTALLMLLLDSFVWSIFLQRYLVKLLMSALVASLYYESVNRFSWRRWRRRIPMQPTAGTPQNDDSCSRR